MAVEQPGSKLEADLRTNVGDLLVALHRLYPAYQRNNLDIAITLYKKDANTESVAKGGQKIFSVE
ncbi:hypothetical protein EBZ97_03125, partial [bacterium]|nr:hypothetical protein [bacterium]